LAIVLHDLRVPDLVKIRARKTQGIALVSRIITERFENPFLSFERLVGMLRVQAQTAVGRIYVPGRRHRACRAGRTPEFHRPGNIVARGRAGFLAGFQRVGYRAAPAIQKHGAGSGDLLVFF